MTSTSASSTSANDLIMVFPELGRMFDPADSNFRNLSGTRGSFETAVLSVLLGRASFWITHSLAFGYALDIGRKGGAGDVTAAGPGDVGPGPYRELFGIPAFERYTAASGYDPDDRRLLDTATVLDSLLNTDARLVAMRGTVAINECIRGCNGDGDCVRRCISGVSGFG